MSSQSPGGLLKKAGSSALAHLRGSFDVIRDCLKGSEKGGVFLIIFGPISRKPGPCFAVSGSQIETRQIIISPFRPEKFPGLNRFLLNTSPRSEIGILTERGKLYFDSRESFSPGYFRSLN